MKGNPWSRILWLSLFLIIISIVDLGLNFFGWIPLVGDVIDLLSNTILEVIQIILVIIIGLIAYDK
jgi:hypothetical protein